MNELRKFLTIALFLLSGAGVLTGQNYQLPSRSALNFIVISDFGRNGYYNQKEVADMMAVVAPECGVRFYVTGGDNFQVAGVQSTRDPLWMSSIENIYTQPSSHNEWYPALGNHDHGGNVQAQIDYSEISRRWKMPANYYTLVKTRDSVSIRLLILDTAPLISELSRPEGDTAHKDARRQLAWVDSVLTVEKEDWVIVVGHHPVYSAHPTRGNSKELVENLTPLLNRHQVDFYIGAHDHIFQHLKDSTGNVDYFVNTAASEVRPSAGNNMTLFTASSPGFSICSATEKNLSIYFIGKEGKAIYSYSRERKP